MFFQVEISQRSRQRNLFALYNLTIELTFDDTPSLSCGCETVYFHIKQVCENCQTQKFQHCTMKMKPYNIFITKIPIPCHSATEGIPYSVIAKTLSAKRTTTCKTEQSSSNVARNQ